jgi:hypothetical protein
MIAKFRCLSKVTFNDFYLSRFTTEQLVLNSRADGTGYPALTPPFIFASAMTFRMAMAWANLDAAFCLNGGTVTGRALVGTLLVLPRQRHLPGIPVLPAPAVQRPAADADGAVGVPRHVDHHLPPVHQPG